MTIQAVLASGGEVPLDSATALRAMPDGALVETMRQMHSLIYVLAGGSTSAVRDACELLGIEHPWPAGLMTYPMKSAEGEEALARRKIETIAETIAAPISLAERVRIIVAENQGLDPVDLEKKLQTVLDEALRLRDVDAALRAPDQPGPPTFFGIPIRPLDNEDVSPLRDPRLVGFISSMLRQDHPRSHADPISVAEVAHRDGGRGESATMRIISALTDLDRPLSPDARAFIAGVIEAKMR